MILSELLTDLPLVWGHSLPPRGERESIVTISFADPTKLTTPDPLFLDMLREGLGCGAVVAGPGAPSLRGLEIGLCPFLVALFRILVLCSFLSSALSMWPSERPLNILPGVMLRSLTLTGNGDGESANKTKKGHDQTGLGSTSSRGHGVEAGGSGGLQLTSTSQGHRGPTLASSGRVPPMG